MIMATPSVMGPQPRAPSGAIVFGTGTVFLSFGLDTTHDYANDDPNGLVVPVDPNVQQAMVNLFADMSVQPQTLQSDLIAATASTDHTPPVSTISAPVAGASFVQQQPVTISGSASDTGGLVAVVEVSTTEGQPGIPPRERQAGFSCGGRDSRRASRSSPAVLTTVSIWKRPPPVSP